MSVSNIDKLKKAELKKIVLKQRKLNEELIQYSRKLNDELYSERIEFQVMEASIGLITGFIISTVIYILMGGFT